MVFKIMHVEKKEVPQGSLLLTEKPFVYTLCSKFRTERCDFCFNKTELSKCTACRYVYYCDRSCQKKGWSVHKLECQNLKQIAPRVLPDSARILARLIKILDNGGVLTKSFYTQRSYRTFKDLMSHYSDIKNDKARLEHFSSLYGVLQQYFVNESLPNSAELLTMFGKMCVNSFSICNQELQSVGTGIYLAASVLDHSCAPNAVVTFEGTTLNLRSLEKLPSLNWSKIFISYIDVMTLTSERRKELETNYYFLCECPKCLAPERLFEMTGSACPNSNCDNCIDVINVEPGQICPKCGTTISDQFLCEFKEIMEMTQMHLSDMKETTYLDVCRVCINKHKGYLYKYNVKHLKMLDLAFDSSIEFGKFDEAKHYGSQLIESFYKYYGKIHPLTGLLHLKLGKILLYEEQLKPAFDHLKKAKEILEITHGAKSSMCQKHLIPLLQQAFLELQRG